MTTRLRFRTTLGLTLVGAFALTACSTQDSAGFSDEATAGSAPANSSPAQTPDPQASQSQTPGRDNVLVAEVDEPVEFQECLEAEDIDGATVEWLDDVVIPEEEHEGLEPETVEVAGQDVELPGTPSIVVPERVGQAGCLIEYPAPGGCLPAVEISGSFIPGYRIPERTVEATELPDGTVLDELVQDGVTSQAVEDDGEYQEQVCQTEPDDAEDGDFISHAFRSHTYRSHIFASHDYNGPVRQGATTTESGDRLSGREIPSYRLSSMRVDSARIDSARLDSYRVEGTDHTEYTQDDETTSYTTEGDVLFDSDDHALRSEAESELQAIADDIAQRDDDYTITVEGHTDDLPSQEYTDNTELSEQRAEAVVAWLQDNADVTDGDVTAEGMGDEYPRASNDTDEGRQENRRVVMTVQPVDYEPEIDYETDDGE